MLSVKLFFYILLDRLLHMYTVDEISCYVELSV